MDQDAGFDRPWRDIETLLKWIGKDEPAGLTEIEKHAERLGLTRQLGSLYSGFGILKPREAIPEIEFADCVLQKFNDRYVYLSNPETRGSPRGGWQHLRLRADKAKAVWSHGQAAMPQCVLGEATHRPAYTRQAEPQLEQRSKPKRGVYQGDLATFMARKGLKLMRRMTPKDIAKSYIEEHRSRECRGDSVPPLPSLSNRLTRIAKQAAKIRQRMEEESA